MNIWIFGGHIQGTAIPVLAPKVLQAVLSLTVPSIFSYSVLVLLDIALSLWLTTRSSSLSCSEIYRIETLSPVLWIKKTKFIPSIWDPEFLIELLTNRVFYLASTIPDCRTLRHDTTWLSPFWLSRVSHLDFLDLLFQNILLWVNHGMSSDSIACFVKSKHLQICISPFKEVLSFILLWKNTYELYHLNEF